MNNSLASLLLAIPLLLTLISSFVTTVPGAMVNVYLIAAATCIPAIAYNRKWRRWIAITLAFLILFIASSDHKRGLDYWRQMGERLGRAPEKTMVPQ